VTITELAGPAHVPAELLRDFDHISDQDFLQDPFGNLEAHRGDRVFYSVNWGGYWVLTRAADIREAYQSPDRFSAYPGGLPAREGAPPMIPEEMDPPEHTKYRQAMSSMFSPRRVATLTDEVRALAVQLVDDVAPRGRIDFVEDFAVPLPTRVFMRQLGLPLEDGPRFVEWNNVLLHALGEEKARANREIGEFLTDLVRQRAEDPREDWISELLSQEVDGKPLEQHVVVGMTFLLFLAGLETVTAALTFATNFLARNPEYREQLVADPGLIPGAVEELLRFQSFANTARTVTHDLEFAGVQMAKGDKVWLSNSLASRDPAEVEDSGTVDFGRKANRHFAFGAGAHRCVGSHLARLEMKIALEEWHRRIPEYRRADADRLRVWGGNNMAIQHLAIEWDRA
jgi:cytochrome P450